MEGKLSVQRVPSAEGICDDWLQEETLTCQKEMGSRSSCRDEAEQGRGGQQEGSKLWAERGTLVRGSILRDSCLRPSTHCLHPIP